MTKKLATTEERPTESLLRLPEVEAMAGIRRATIYRWMAEGQFPQPLELGPRTVRWRASEITAWIESLPARSERIGVERAA